MRFVTGKELKKMKAGTLFIRLRKDYEAYGPSALESGDPLTFILNSPDEMFEGFNGTISLLPDFTWTREEPAKVTNWASDDTMYYDYDDDDMFAVFDYNDKLMMMRILYWSIKHDDEDNVDIDSAMRISSLKDVMDYFVTKDGCIHEDDITKYLSEQDKVDLHLR